jgi:hypothetical protein
VFLIKAKPLSGRTTKVWLKQRGDGFLWQKKVMRSQVKDVVRKHSRMELSFVLPAAIGLKN